MTTPGINSTHTDYLTPQNTKVKKESYGKNGTMKETTIFDANGKATKVVREYDTNGDGKIDKKQTQIINTKNINGGAMNVYDDNGDGKANRYTEVVETAYEEKILYDDNGDGKVDRIEILDKVKGNTLNKLSAQEYENKYGKKAEFSKNPDSFGV